MIAPSHLTGDGIADLRASATIPVTTLVIMLAKIHDTARADSLALAEPSGGGRDNNPPK
jgi:hypothetical protein